MTKLDFLSHLSSPKGSRRRAIEVHALLRSKIVSGEIPPGAILSQQDLSRQLNVSRTPIREALRKLHEEELIEGEPNIRARAAGFDLDRLEVLYSTRIVVESLAVSMSVPLLTQSDFGSLDRQIERLASVRAQNDFAYWLLEHRRFHLLLVGKCSRAMVDSIEANCERGDRYLHLFHNRHPPGWWMRGDVEHREIVGFAKARDAARTARVVALHIGRTAIDLASELAPDREPRHLRAAVRLATSQEAFSRDVGGADPTKKMRRLAQASRDR